MTKAKRYYWLKLKEDFFEDDTADFRAFYAGMIMFSKFKNQ